MDGALHAGPPYARGSRTCHTHRRQAHGCIALQQSSAAERHRRAASDTNERPSPMRIGFFFNHDASHHVPNSTSIAAALAKRGIAVEILTSSEQQRALARELLPPDATVQFRSLTIGAVGPLAASALR